MQQKLLPSDTQHRPPSQFPVQHWPPCVQVLPAGRQQTAGSQQTPPSHTPEQQSAAELQAEPSPQHGVAHTPSAHEPMQQSLSFVHAAPVDEQPALHSRSVSATRSPEEADPTLPLPSSFQPPTRNQRNEPEGGLAASSASGPVVVSASHDPQESGPACIRQVSPASSPA